MSNPNVFEVDMIPTRLFISHLLSSVLLGILPSNLDLYDRT